MSKFGTVATLAAFLFLPAIPALADEPMTGTDLTCAGPVTGKDTAQTILERFKGDAEIADLPGAEGETMKGVALYPNDPSKRIDIYFFDAEMTQISLLSPGAEAKGWSVYGLKPGMAMKDIVAANGASFSFYGFGWDYGGYVTDLNDGKLAHTEDGCHIGLRFEIAEDQGLPTTLAGEVELSSSDPAVMTLNPVLSSVSIGWAAKEDQE